MNNKMKKNEEQYEKTSVFASFATVNRLTICVNRLTRSKNPPGWDLRALGKISRR